LKSAFRKKALICASVIIKVETFDTLAQLLRVIPHSVSFLVPIALESKIFTKKYIQILVHRQQIILCRFMVSVVNSPGYFGKRIFPAKQNVEQFAFCSAYNAA
jgi:hypothetical protein